MVSPELEEQQEKLRRAVDGWRCRSLQLLRGLRDDPYVSCSPSAATTAGDSGGASSRPIGVHVEPLEHSDLPSLVDSDNVDVAKFVMVLAYDCSEISRLRRHASRNIYRKLLLFGHRSSPQDVLLEGEPQKAFGQSLSLFMELYETVSRMSAVLGNLLQQLDYIYSQQDKNGLPHRSFKNVCLRTLFESLGEGLGMFLVLDEILRRNTLVKGHLSLFRRMLIKVKLELDAFDISGKDLDCLDQVVCHLERLFDGGLFQCVLHEGSYLNDMLQKASCNKKLMDAFTLCTYDGLLELLPRLDTWKEYPFHRRKMLQQIAVFLFSAHAFAEAPEKKVRKAIMDVIQAVPVIYVDCGIRFTILDLIKNQCPQLVSSWPSLREAEKDYDLTMKNYLARLSESYSRDWQATKDALSCWLASYQSTVYPTGELSKSHGDFQVQLRQIIQGILLANRMRMLALSILDLHSLLEVPIRKEKFSSLCHLLILLKVMANKFHTKEEELIQCLPHVISLMQTNIEELLVPAKVQLHLEVKRGSQMGKMRFLGSLTRAGRDADAKLTDSLSLVLISMQLLQGNGSLKRQLIFSIAMDVLQSIGHVDIDFFRIKKIMSKLAMIADFKSTVEEITDCSFLYWRKEMMRDWLAMVYIDNKFSWLQHLLDAFCDGLWLLDLGCVGRHAQLSYEKELEVAVMNEIMLPLCRDIENDLRLHVHSANLKGSVHVNPTKTGVRNLSWYLQLRPLRLPYKFIDIRILVECYLNSTFYNHIAMALYNWKVYSEMQHLAELKYRLLLDDIHLPEHSSGHGFDLAGVLKNFGTFARNYSYNMTKQIFIEKIVDGQVKKTLTVVGVEHVASAIAAHGLTTISAATKNVIRFLTQRMSRISELLLDDLLRSILLKERVWKNEKGLSNIYPFTRAEQLSATMAKHSFGSHEINVVEQLCSIISEIGNGMGLIRILHSGGSRLACRISRCEPRNKMSFMESDQPPISRDEVGTPGKVMDEAVDSKCQSMHTMDHFSLLLSSLSKELQRGGYLGLVDFHFLIPALVVNLIESKLHLKEKPLRRDRETGSQIIAEDGFVMGATWILKITGQENSFEELCWFASANKHLEEALTSLGHRTDHPKGSRILGLKLWDQSPMSVSPETQKGIDKIKRSQKEMKLIEYGFNVARAIMSEGISS